MLEEMPYGSQNHYSNVFTTCTVYVFYFPNVFYLWYKKKISQSYVTHISRTFFLFIKLSRKNYNTIPTHKYSISFITSVENRLSGLINVEGGLDMQIFGYLK